MALFRTTGRHLIASRLAGIETHLADMVRRLQALGYAVDELAQGVKQGQQDDRTEFLIVGDRIAQETHALALINARIRPLRQELLK